MLLTGATVTLRKKKTTFRPFGYASIKYQISKRGSLFLFCFYSAEEENPCIFVFECFLSFLPLFRDFGGDPSRKQVFDLLFCLEDYVSYFSVWVVFIMR